ncbi:hypothetical protein [Phyllobacterium myrsinacearum]|uniref:hypothetical protein n=1 Tax=Phyllobacterium myrsinacearum TaxID=28101 RepID=UPI001029B2A8|nr:hypothetical protein [Phyllobacterium myrsinacearum]
MFKALRASLADAASIRPSSSFPGIYHSFLHYTRSRASVMDPIKRAGSDLVDDLHDALQSYWLHNEALIVRCTGVPASWHNHIKARLKRNRPWQNAILVTDEGNGRQSAMVG